MNFDEIASSIGENAIEIVNTYFSHTIIFLIVSTLAGFWLFFRERSEWRHARFLGRVNLSMNSLHGKTLRIRTVHEGKIESVIMSKYARKLVHDAAKQTSLLDPLLALQKRARCVDGL